MAIFSSYFTARFVLSKGAIFTLVLSDRSDGKTFDCGVRALEDYENNKDVTIYMRRYKTEIDRLLYEHFFDKILAEEKYSKYRTWQFKGSKQGIQVKQHFKDEWDWIVLFITLSTATRKKSVIDSLFNRIKVIDYDEVIPMDGRYLPDEPKLVIDFYKTVDRDRDIVQLIMLGNRITPFCPYFDFWNLSLDIVNKNLKLYKNDTVAVQIYTNAEHREKREKSRFRQAVEGTGYEEYDKGGILNDLDLKKRTIKGLEYWCSFLTERGEGSIWFDGNSMCISEKIRRDGFLLTDKSYNLNREYYIANFGKFPTFLKSIYRQGSMYFETDKAFYLFEKILLKISAK